MPSEKPNPKKMGTCLHCGDAFSSRAITRHVGSCKQAGDRFSYIYDYGSSTELQGRVVRAIDDGVAKPSVRVVARNVARSELCACGQPATSICTLCDSERVCEACRDKHHSTDCEGMCLPLVNSPRAGVCAYCG